MAPCRRASSASRRRHSWLLLALLGACRGPELSGTVTINAQEGVPNVLVSPVFLEGALPPSSEGCYTTAFGLGGFVSAGEVTVAAGGAIYSILPDGYGHYGSRILPGTGMLPGDTVSVSAAGAEFPSFSLTGQMPSYPGVTFSPAVDAGVELAGDLVATWTPDGSADLMSVQFMTGFGIGFICHAEEARGQLTIGAEVKAYMRDANRLTILVVRSRVVSGSAGASLWLTTMERYDDIPVL